MDAFWPFSWIFLEKGLLFSRFYGILDSASGLSLELCMIFMPGRGFERNDFTMLKLAVTIIQVLCGLVLIAVVMLQSGKSAGLSGAISGAADTFLSKNKAKSVDAKLAKATKWVAIAFVLLTLSLSIIH